jgi:hypothetical protein
MLCLITYRVDLISFILMERDILNRTGIDVVVDLGAAGYEGRNGVIGVSV